MNLFKRYFIPCLLAIGIIIMFYSCKTQDEILGCTDLAAFNYNPAANTDDGSCEPKVFGCIYECSENYNPDANTDDGSCILDRDKFIGIYEVFSECRGPYYAPSDITIIIIIC